VAWSRDGQLATTGPELWPATGRTPVWPATVPPPPDNGPVKITDNVAAFAPDGRALLLSRSVGQPGLALWDTMTDLVRASDGAIMSSLGRRLGRRPSFAADGSWVVAGGNALHLASGQVRSITSDRASSVFLPDNRIVASATEGILRLYCPSRP